jgi:large subunit ribosomal protein L24
MLVCPRCGKPTRVGFTFLTDGTKQRACKKCREILEK